MTAPRPADTGATVSTDDPTSAILTVNDALTAARIVVESTAAAVPTMRLRQTSEDLESRAAVLVPVLASLLYAASPARSGGGIGGMDWVKLALDNVDPDDVSGEPGWREIAVRCRGHRLLEAGARVILNIAYERDRNEFLLALQHCLDQIAAPQLRPTNVDNTTERN